MGENQIFHSKKKKKKKVKAQNVLETSVFLFLHLGLNVQWFSN